MKMGRFKKYGACGKTRPESSSLGEYNVVPYIHFSWLLTCSEFLTPDITFCRQKSRLVRQGETISETIAELMNNNMNMHVEALWRPNFPEVWLREWMVFGHHSGSLMRDSERWSSELLVSLAGGFPFWDVLVCRYSSSVITLRAKTKWGAHVCIAAAYSMHNIHT